MSPKGSLILNESKKQAFNAMITEIIELLALSHQQPKCTNNQLITDSNDDAVGDTLHQVVDGNLISVRFFSK